MKSVKYVKAIVTAATMSALGCMIAPYAITVGAADTGNAYVFIRDVAEDGVRFEGIDATVNTISDGATTAEISADGSYNVSIDLSKESAFETVDEISMLKLYVCGTEKTKNVNVTVDEFKINGKAVELNGTPTVQDSGNDYYIDLCDTNGAELFNRTDYVKTISTIDIAFTVSGWPIEEETTVASETTVPETTTAQATTTASTTAIVKQENSTPTGDNGAVGVVFVMAFSAVIGAVTSNRKK